MLASRALRTNHLIPGPRRQRRHDRSVPEQIAFSRGCSHNEGHLKTEATIAVSKAAQFRALGFGLFLGLCIWKFGNPVILDRIVRSPVTAADLFHEPWPPHWAAALLLPIAVVGALACVRSGPVQFPSKWLWLLPLIWFGWQLISATQTVDAPLTAATLWQFAGCLAGYFLGARLFNNPVLLRWLLAGILAAFAYALIRGIDQHLFEFPANLQMLRNGEATGWTNFPPEVMADMRTTGVILHTNGVDIASPIFVAKFAGGRVSGTLVYPNALAQLILLLWPAALALAFGATNLRPPVRLAALTLTFLLGAGAFFWTGSKLGWLIALALLGLWLLRFPWPPRLKVIAVSAVLLVGLIVFAVRFHHYFAAGATSAGARFDYWRAALQTTAAHPAFGTGPGTFQRPYAQIKAPGAEMARLAHNDYLEQFSDSGIPGGLAYAGWIVLALITLGRNLWRRAPDLLCPAVFLGLLGWFAQGVGEFGLFVPALAWTAFTLLGSLITMNLPDSAPPHSNRQMTASRLL